MDPTAIASCIDAYPAPHAPFAHQRTALARSLTKRHFALLMDQGTGKTKVILDTTGIMYMRGHVAGLLILAPNSIHTQWVVEEIPKHLPSAIPRRCVVWRSSSQKRVREAKELCSTRGPRVLRVLAMNHEALGTKKGEAVARAFLTAFPSLMVIDESHEGYRQRKGARARAARRLSPRAFMRRISSGTPMEKPFDLYAQFEFLHPKILGFEDEFVAFKHHYGVFTKQYAYRMNKRTQRQERYLYEVLVEHRRLNELRARVNEYAYRVKKEECVDIPPKLYSVIPVSMTATEREVYGQLTEEGIAFIEMNRGRVQPRSLSTLPPSLLAALLANEDSDDDIHRVSRTTTTLAIALLVRLQQVAGGFLTTDDGTIRPLNTRVSPRVQAVVQKVGGALENGEKAIVWAKYRPELSLLHRTLRDEFDTAEYGGAKAVLVDGTVKGEARERAIAEFKDPQSRTRILVAHPKTMGTGQNLQVARTLVYYSNLFSAILRTQSEDRAHRIGQLGTVNVYDVTSAPVDAKILECIRQKRNVTDALWGDGTTAAPIDPLRAVQELMAAAAQEE